VYRVDLEQLLKLIAMSWSSDPHGSPEKNRSSRRVRCSSLDKQRRKRELATQVIDLKFVREDRQRAGFFAAALESVVLPVEPMPCNNSSNLIPRPSAISKRVSRFGLNCLPVKILLSVVCETPEAWASQYGVLPRRRKCFSKFEARISAWLRIPAAPCR
jgi:hypothetical protein